MKGARIYKDNFRENPLFALFLADSSPLLVIGIGIFVVEFVIFFLLLRFSNPPLMLLIIAFSELAFFMLTTGKKDNEMKIKALPRQIAALFRKKQRSTKELDTTLSDFTIVGDYILRHKKLIAVYEIFPSDITFLDTEALEKFYEHIKMSYHNLTANMMLVAKKQVATSKDYTSHFYAHYVSADTKREELIKQYQEELSDFIDTNSFKKVGYYAIFSTPLLSHGEKHFALSIKQLYDLGNRFSSSLLSANITTKQLIQEELIAYSKAQLQNI